MFIYCSGDSFTRGAELADDMLPSWPGTHAMFDEKAQQAGMAWFVKKRNVDLYRLTIEERAEFDRVEVERAWPHQLGKLIGADVVNSGIGGSSQGDTNYRIMIDIEQLVAQGQKIDAVFIQVTSAERIEMYDHFKYRSATDYTSSSRMVHWAQHYPHNDKMLMKYWDLVEADSGKHIRAMTHLVFIRNYIKAKLGIEPIFLDSVFISYYEKCFSELIAGGSNSDGELKVLLDAANIIDFDTCTSKLLDMTHLVDPEKSQLQAAGHYSPEIHQMFAQLLAKTYF